MKGLRLRQGVPRKPVLELPEWETDAELLEAVSHCIALQREAAAEALARHEPDPEADRHVSSAALERAIAEPAPPSDLVEDRTLSNCIAFNFSNVEGALKSRSVARARARVDRQVAKRVRELFEADVPFDVWNSGHFWYPPGGFMTWHHNLRTPGWRLYVAHAEEPGESFFRYRDPDSGVVETLHDGRWSFRLFEIAPERPLWHAIRSETNRFSIGYRILPRPTFAERVRRKLRRWTGLAG